MLDYRVNTFLTLCDEMNYRRTAEQLNMTQPGVTQHIQYLERYYSIKLFEYDGKKLIRTKNAERLKKYFDGIKAEEVAIKENFVPTDTIHVTLGATKTIGEYVIMQEIRDFLKTSSHELHVYIDNTENLLHMLEKQTIDFAIVEGMFDKSKYEYHLYKKEAFVGICSPNHPFANKTVLLEDIFSEDIVVREQHSGTRMLLQNAITDRGFTLENFNRCIMANNFNIICDIVANNNAITFAYKPVMSCRKDLATFNVADMQISGEFNFVYCNERIAKQKINHVFKDVFN